MPKRDKEQPKPPSKANEDRLGQDFEVDVTFKKGNPRSKGGSLGERLKHSINGKEKKK